MRATALTALAIGLSLVGAAGAQAVTPLGVACAPDASNGGVRICNGSTATRVESFDHLPLDVNVVLPADGDSGLPLITMMHGFGGDKQAATATGGDASQLGSMVSYAKRGYGVLSFAARGFKESCGSPTSRVQSAQLGAAAFQACQQGWIHLDDMRYEARDAQWLMGKLVDQGIVDPQRLGATGVSYGGITTTQLAALRDRMLQLGGELADGTFVNFLPVSAVEHVVEQIRAGEERSGREAGSSDVVCRFFCIPQPAEEGIGLARFMFAAYGTVPVYEAFFRSLGWGEQLDPMVSAWREGDRKAALERAPDELIREIFIFGSPEQQKARLDEFAGGGITTFVLTPIATPDALPGLIDALAR